MGHLNSLLADFCRGDAKLIERTVDVSDVYPDTLAKVWLTIKSGPGDEEADIVVQKYITPVLGASGHIDEIGGGSPITAAHFSFILTAAETFSLDADTIYHFNFKARSSGDAPVVVEGGRIWASETATLRDD